MNLVTLIHTLDVQAAQHRNCLVNMGYAVLFHTHMNLVILAIILNLPVILVEASAGI